VFAPHAAGRLLCGRSLPGSSVVGGAFLNPHASEGMASARSRSFTAGSAPQALGVSSSRASCRSLLAAAAGEFQTSGKTRTAPVPKQRWVWEDRAASIEENQDPMNVPRREIPYNRAKGTGELPYAALREKPESTTYRRTFNGECPWALGSSTFRQPSRPATGIYRTAEFLDERPKTSLPATPLDSATQDYQAAVIKRMRSQPWGTVVPHEPAESSAKFNYTLSDTKFPLSATRTVRITDVQDIQDRLLSVPFVDLTSADGRASTVVRPHGVGALVDGPLKATSSFRRVSQLRHF